MDQFTTRWISLGGGGGPAAAAAAACRRCQLEPRWAAASSASPPPRAVPLDSAAREPRLHCPAGFCSAMLCSVSSGSFHLVSSLLSLLFALDAAWLDPSRWVCLSLSLSLSLSLPLPLPASLHSTLLGSGDSARFIATILASTRLVSALLGPIPLGCAPLRSVSPRSSLPLPVRRRVYTESERAGSEPTHQPPLTWARLDLRDAAFAFC